MTNNIRKQVKHRQRPGYGYLGRRVGFEEIFQVHEDVRIPVERAVRGTDDAEGEHPGLRAHIIWYLQHGNRWLKRY